MKWVIFTGILKRYGKRVVAISQSAI